MHVYPKVMSGRSGFSLVELSIVLVILGLLVGGILSGQSLIHAAELRSVSTQRDRYASAVQAFRDKYFQLPGDFNNAESFWGQQAAGIPCRTTASSGALTCNGNGDGQFAAFMMMDSGGVWHASDESFRAWQHLANAGLIEGQFAGISGGGLCATATNGLPACPLGKISNSAWFMNTYSVSISSANGFDNAGGDNGLEFIGTLGTGILSPQDIWNIDTKVDDGKPATGKILVYAETALSDCTDAAGTTAVQAASLSANYLLSATTTSCGMFYHKQF